jgi:hypothetical protein
MSPPSPVNKVNLVKIIILKKLVGLGFINMCVNEKNPRMKKT